MTSLERWILGAALAATGCGEQRAPLDPTEPTLLISTLRAGTVDQWSSEGELLGTLVSSDALPRRLRDRPFEPSSARWVGDELWVTNFATGDVLAFDRAGAFLRSVFENGTGVRIEEPAVLQIAGGQAWVLGNDTHNLVDVGGTEPFEVASPSGMLRNAHGLALSEDELAWVGTSPFQQDLGMIQLVDLRSGDVLDHFGVYGELEDATGIARDPEGWLIVADFFEGAVSRWDPDTRNRLHTLADARTGLDRPIAVEVDAAGDLWVLDVAGVVRIGAAAERVVRFEVPEVAFARGLTVTGP